jgi:hypothetical protein
MGSIANADAVIGADGIKSVVRHQILNIGKLRSSKQKCWRGVSESDWTAKYNHQAYEAWGKGRRFGFVKLMTTKSIGTLWLTRTWLKIRIILLSFLLNLIPKFQNDFRNTERKYLSATLSIWNQFINGKKTVFV